MIFGEVFNFVAYAFAPAILVTPFGALAVVVSAILSSFFLNEQLTLFGKIGCFLCINGSVIIALNGPASHAGGSINEFKHLFLAPGFLVWAGICIVASLVLIFAIAPRWGKKNMLVYITICSLLGGLSVSTTSGLGSAILLTIRGDMQLKNWFFYVLLVFVAVTLIAEIIYLNKALELFHTSMVTAVYYTTFTSATLVSTIVLFKGLDAAPTTIITLVLGFLTIVTGIVLLQLSKVDPEILDADKTPGLDRSTTLLMRASRSMTSVRSEKHGSVHTSTTALDDPGIDTMRGAGGIIGSIVRARSSRRLHTSADEYAQMDGHGMDHLNTRSHHDLERYQLHDNPMQRNASMISGRSGSASGALSPTSATMPNMPKRGPSMVSFTSESLEPHGHHRGPGGMSLPHSHSPGHGHGILSPPQKYGFLGTSESSQRQLSDIKESGGADDDDEKSQHSRGARADPLWNVPTLPRDHRYNSTLSAMHYDRDGELSRSSTPKARDLPDHDLGRTQIPRSDENYDLRNMFDPSAPGMVGTSSPLDLDTSNPFDSTTDLSTLDSRDSLANLANPAQTRENKKKYPSAPKKKRSGDRSHHGGGGGGSSQVGDGDDDQEAEELLSPNLR